MKTFKVNKNLSIVCEYKNTRNGFKHEATLLQNGRSIDFSKVCYLNRTWESFEFETVIIKLLDLNKDIIPKGIRTRFLNKTSGKVKKQIADNFRSIATIAKIGGLFSNDQKETNNWKTRMLKAGLPGIDIPADWNTLSENEKETRLNNVITELTK